MGTSFDSDGWDAGIPPSISRDKWTRHALHKMTRGYCIILSTERRSACFFMAGKGYEGCPYKAARQLILDGFIVEGGKHPLGTIYLLDPEALNRAAAPQTRTPFTKKHRFRRDDEDVAHPARMKEAEPEAGYDPPEGLLPEDTPGC